MFQLRITSIIKSKFHRSYKHFHEHNDCYNKGLANPQNASLVELFSVIPYGWYRGRLGMPIAQSRNVIAHSAASDLWTSNVFLFSAKILSLHAKSLSSSFFLKHNPYVPICATIHQRTHLHYSLKICEIMRNMFMFSHMIYSYMFACINKTLLTSYHILTNMAFNWTYNVVFFQIRYIKNENIVICNANTHIQFLFLFFIHISH